MIFLLRRLDIYEYGASIRDGDDNQVRGTGVESLFPWVADGILNVVVMMHM
jgi:hypothetical protein